MARRLVKHPRRGNSAPGLLLEDGSDLLLEDGGRLLLEVDVEVTASWLAPRPLTGEEQGMVGLVAALSADYVAMRDASPEEMLFVGLAVYLLLREFTARFLRP